MSSIINKPDGSIVVTVRLTIRHKGLIEAIRGAPRRGLARTLVYLMLNGISSKPVEIEDDEDDIDLTDMAIVL